MIISLANELIFLHHNFGHAPPSTIILSLEAQLSLLYAIALHYDTELSNLYHELFMKSLKDDDTRKINLDDILKERRIVENEIMGRVSSIYDK